MPEKTVQYAESVATLPEAWAYVMSVVDEFPRPQISIAPKVIYNVAALDEDAREELFEVTVRGIVA